MFKGHYNIIIRPCASAKSDVWTSICVHTVQPFRVKEM